MSDNSKESDLCGTEYPMESVKVVAESGSIANLATELADDILTEVKNLVQDGAQFMNNVKCTNLTQADVDRVLEEDSLKPQRGFHSEELLTHRFASGRKQEANSIKETELNLKELIENGPQHPIDVSLKRHCLCTGEEQPEVPENPPPLATEDVDVVTADPLKKRHKPISETSGVFKQVFKKIETVQIKQLARHELPLEQEVYFREITEACVGLSNMRREEALYTLTNYTGLYEMLPRLSTFIIESVRVNVVQNNLLMLIYLMRMVKALVYNQHLYIEKNLHELIPSVITCIVSRKLCLCPEKDNPWPLRDYAAQLISQICKKFNTPTNNIQARIVVLFNDALKQDDKLPLSSLYGVTAGLSALGSEVVKTYIIPRITSIGSRIMIHLEGPQFVIADALNAQKIRSLLLKVLVPIIKSIKAHPDNIEDYKNDYGYLGPALYNGVVHVRLQTIMSPSFVETRPQHAIPPAASLSSTITSQHATSPLFIFQTRPQHARPLTASMTSTITSEHAAPRGFFVNAQEQPAISPAASLSSTITSQDATPPAFIDRTREQRAILPATSVTSTITSGDSIHLLTPQVYIFNEHSANFNANKNFQNASNQGIIKFVPNAPKMQSQRMVPCQQRAVIMPSRKPLAVPQSKCKKKLNAPNLTKNEVIEIESESEKENVPNAPKNEK